MQAGSPLDSIKDIFAKASLRFIIQQGSSCRETAVDAEIEDIITG